MHPVRLISFTLGLWLAGGLFMAWVATQNFRGVDRLLNAPAGPAKPVIDSLDQASPGGARTFLRYHASEQNRYYFATWEAAQIAIGTCLLAFLLFRLRGDRFTIAVVALLLLMSLGQRLLLTPDVVTVGRSLDFVPQESSATERSQFWFLHNIYSGVEVTKWILIVAGVGRLVLGRHRNHSHSVGRVRIAEEIR